MEVYIKGSQIINLVGMLLVASVWSKHMRVIAGVCAIALSIYLRTKGL